MNLIYLRAATPKTRKFIKKKLRARDAASVHRIEAGDCALPAAPVRRRDYIVTFLNEVSPEMLTFMYASPAWASLHQN